ncbi:DUF1566 domain-containing protein [Roseateles sp. UC29_93]|uniref:Lcl C-terminal domain-containing protein n=1 Tax=Roseateles sp. UC29_93 TaxID=3350177 RepID=UPI00366B1F51
MSKKISQPIVAMPQGWFPRIGDIWPGQGIYAGIVRGEPGLPDYHLFVSADVATDKERVAFGGYGKESPALSTFDGARNTHVLVESPDSYPAAEWAASLDVDGHKDWYLPSRRELRLLWINVPELFKTNAWYWSSTQFSAHYAWNQSFDDGYQDGGDKDFEYRARAVRRFLIQ